MELTAIAEKIGAATLGIGKSIWQRWRFGARATIDLSWDHPPVIFLDRPTPHWRSLRLIVTAPKKEEFVVAAGSIQAKLDGKGRWKNLGKLEDLFHLPITVEPNRQWADDMSGDTLTALFPDSSPDQVIVLRVVLEDFHKTSLRTNALKLTTRVLKERRSS